MLACPSISCTARKSPLDCSRCDANECLSACHPIWRRPALLHARHNGNRVSTVPGAMCRALAAKGMLAPDGCLTPAGEHAIHVDDPGQVPGIDN